MPSGEGTLAGVRITTGPLRGHLATVRETAGEWLIVDVHGLPNPKAIDTPWCRANPCLHAVREEHTETVGQLDLFAKP